MNVNKTQFEFFEAAVKLQLNQGKTVIYRKELIKDWLKLDPQPDYGTGIQFGAVASHAMRKVAQDLGGTYKKDKATGPNANARIEF